jgi:hypothetical protein
MFTEELVGHSPSITSEDQSKCLAERCFELLVDRMRAGVTGPGMGEEQFRRVVLDGLAGFDTAAASSGDLWTIVMVAWLWEQGEGWTPTGWPHWFTETSAGVRVSDEMRWVCWSSHWDGSPYDADPDWAECLSDYHRRLQDREARAAPRNGGRPADFDELVEELEQDELGEVDLGRVDWTKEGF